MAMAYYYNNNRKAQVHVVPPPRPRMISSTTRLVPIRPIVNDEQQEQENDVDVVAAMKMAARGRGSQSPPLVDKKRHGILFGALYPDYTSPTPSASTTSSRSTSSFLTTTSSLSSSSTTTDHNNNPLATCTTSNSSSRVCCGHTTNDHDDDHDHNDINNNNHCRAFVASMMTRPTTATKTAQDNNQVLASTIPIIDKNNSNKNKKKQTKKNKNINRNQSTPNTNNNNTKTGILCQLLWNRQWEAVRERFVVLLTSQLVVNDNQNDNHDNQNDNNHTTCTDHHQKKNDDDDDNDDNNNDDELKILANLPCFSNGAQGLPLHLACAMRPLPPYDIVRTLLQLYPAAAQQRANMWGLLPLHLAVDLRGGPSTTTTTTTTPSTTQGGDAGQSCPNTKTDANTRSRKKEKRTSGSIPTPSSSSSSASTLLLGSTDESFLGNSDASSIASSSVSSRRKVYLSSSFVSSLSSSSSSSSSQTSSCSSHHNSKHKSINNHNNHTDRNGNGNDNDVLLTTTTTTATTATRSDHCRIVQALLETYPPAVYVREEFEGMLPLHIAASSTPTVDGKIPPACARIIARLIEEAPDTIHCQDYAGDTPWVVAARRRRPNDNQYQPQHQHSTLLTDSGTNGKTTTATSMTSALQNTFMTHHNYYNVVLPLPDWKWNPILRHPPRPLLNATTTATTINNSTNKHNFSSLLVGTLDDLMYMSSSSSSELELGSGSVSSHDDESARNNGTNSNSGSGGSAGSSSSYMNSYSDETNSVHLNPNDGDNDIDVDDDNMDREWGTSAVHGPAMQKELEHSIRLHCSFQQQQLQQQPMSLTNCNHNSAVCDGGHYHYYGGHQGSEPVFATATGADKEQSIGFFSGEEEKPDEEQQDDHDDDDDDELVPSLMNSSIGSMDFAQDGVGYSIDDTLCFSNDDTPCFTNSDDTHSYDDVEKDSSFVSAQEDGDPTAELSEQASLEQAIYLADHLLEDMVGDKFISYSHSSDSDGASSYDDDLSDELEQLSNFEEELRRDLESDRCYASFLQYSLAPSMVDAVFSEGEAEGKDEQRGTDAQATADTRQESSSVRRTGGACQMDTQACQDSSQDRSLRVSAPQQGDEHWTSNDDGCQGMQLATPVGPIPELRLADDGVSPAAERSVSNAPVDEGPQPSSFPSSLGSSTDMPAQTARVNCWDETPLSPTPGNAESENLELDTGSAPALSYSADDCNDNSRQDSDPSGPNVELSTKDTYQNCPSLPWHEASIEEPSPLVDQRIAVTKEAADSSLQSHAECKADNTTALESNETVFTGKSLAKGDEQQACLEMGRNHCPARPSKVKTIHNKAFNNTAVNIICWERLASRTNNTFEPSVAVSARLKKERSEPAIASTTSGKCGPRLSSELTSNSKESGKATANATDDSYSLPWEQKRLDASEKDNTCTAHEKKSIELAGPQPAMIRWVRNPHTSNGAASNEGQPEQKPVIDSSMDESSSIDEDASGVALKNENDQTRLGENYQQEARSQGAGNSSEQDMDMKVNAEVVDDQMHLYKDFPSEATDPSRCPRRSFWKFDGGYLVEDFFDQTSDLYDLFESPTNQSDHLSASTPPDVALAHEDKSDHNIIVAEHETVSIGSSRANLFSEEDVHKEETEDLCSTFTSTGCKSSNTLRETLVSHTEISTEEDVDKKETQDLCSTETPSGCKSSNTLRETIISHADLSTEEYFYEEQTEDLCNTETPSGYKSSSTLRGTLISHADLSGEEEDVVDKEDTEDLSGTFTPSEGKSLKRLREMLISYQAEFPTGENFSTGEEASVFCMSAPSECNSSNSVRETVANLNGSDSFSETCSNKDGDNQRDTASSSPFGQYQGLLQNGASLMDNSYEDSLDKDKSESPPGSQQNSVATDDEDGNNCKSAQGRECSDSPVQLSIIRKILVDQRPSSVSACSSSTSECSSGVKDTTNKLGPDATLDEAQVNCDEAAAATNKLGPDQVEGDEAADDKEKAVPLMGKEFIPPPPKQKPLMELVYRVQELNEENNMHSQEKARLEQHVSIMAEIKGVSIGDLRNALQDVCAKEPEPSHSNGQSPPEVVGDELDERESNERVVPVGEVLDHSYEELQEQDVIRAQEEKSDEVDEPTYCSTPSLSPPRIIKTNDGIENWSIKGEPAEKIATSNPALLVPVGAFTGFALDALNPSDESFDDWCDELLEEDAFYTRQEMQHPKHIYCVSVALSSIDESENSLAGLEMRTCIDTSDPQEKTQDDNLNSVKVETDRRLGLRQMVEKQMTARRFLNADELVQSCLDQAFDDVWEQRAPSTHYSEYFPNLPEITSNDFLPVRTVEIPVLQNNKHKRFMEVEVTNSQYMLSSAMDEIVNNLLDERSNSSDDFLSNRNETPRKREKKRRVKISVLTREDFAEGCQSNCEPSPTTIECCGDHIVDMVFGENLKDLISPIQDHKDTVQACVEKLKGAYQSSASQFDSVRESIQKHHDAVEETLKERHKSPSYTDKVMKFRKQIEPNLKKSSFGLTGFVDGLISDLDTTISGLSTRWLSLSRPCTSKSLSKEEDGVEVTLSGVVDYRGDKADPCSTKTTGSSSRQHGRDIGSTTKCCSSPKRSVWW